MQVDWKQMNRYILLNTMAIYINVKECNTYSRLHFLITILLYGIYFKAESGNLT